MPPSAEIKLLHPSPQMQLEVRFDNDLGAYWAYMDARPRPCFSVHLLNDLSAFINTIKQGSVGESASGSHQYQISYGVLASKTPGIFNLGGDLALFRTLIHVQDRNQLLAYGRKCIENLLAWHRNCDSHMTSIALVQGEALGGGFEAALSASALIAEESSRMGFPEILFNLFPGMGAFSFLSRKVGRRLAEEMITGGTIYSARQLYDMGVIDVLAPDGTGEAAVAGYIRKHSRNRLGRQAFERSRSLISPVTYDELLRVVEVWADAALKLQERDLRVMDRLIRAQTRTIEQVEYASSSTVVPLHAIGGND